MITEKNSTKIKEIFQSAQENIPKEIEQFIKSTKEFSNEILAFKALCSDQAHDRALFVFYVELLSKAMKKPSDYSELVSVLLPYLEENISMKTSIIALRSLKALCFSKALIPISYYLTKLMSIAINTKNLKKIGKQINYDNIRISSDEAASEELQMFVIKECIVLIKKHCHTFGNSIGFPEFASVICNELKSKCKVGLYKEITDDLIKYILSRKEYIEEERSKMNVNAVDMNKVIEFEKKLADWKNE